MTEPTSPDLWIRRFHPAPGAEVRLVCLPHAGGSASFYVPASRALSPAVDVLAVQYPGRQDRHAEAPLDDLDTLAGRICAALLPWTDLPLALFGHSMGAVLAFEVARRLETHGVRLRQLLVSGRRPPCLPERGRTHLLPDDRLLADLRSMDGTAAQLLDDEELMRLLLPVLRADYRAVETHRYRAGAPLSCPITVLTGDRDPKVSVEEACRWSEHTSADFELQVLPGGHFYLTEQLPAVLATITERLGITERTGITERIGISEGIGISGGTGQPAPAERRNAAQQVPVDSGYLAPSAAGRSLRRPTLSLR
ncbi:pyochelin biosynthetic protein PchC [Kitasatospora sp. MAP12-15]|uniref:thioesterase II family protein n=1 Tax=unclassified Kitasatospora TaxID=2633591 RepID=UPI00247E84DA|nr:pyochelin biosynthetic protein PchC [Kitasatospora sp. MAP12-44]